jgi:hypothetical protein
MDVLTPQQRVSHIQTTTELIQAVQGVQEVENGYGFNFPNQTDMILKIAEFISMERLCCPFLQFSLRVAVDGEPISLTLTGPMGTLEFLRAEFEGAIP